MANLTKADQLPLIRFRTQVPISLSTQPKSYGNHKAVPMSKEDLFRLLVHGAEDIVAVDGEEETPVTMENYESLFGTTEGGTSSGEPLDRDTSMADDE